jgi:hypothetical protein
LTFFVARARARFSTENSFLTVNEDERHFSREC